MLTKSEMDKATLEATLIANKKVLSAIKENIRSYISLEGEIEDRLEKLEAELEKVKNE